MAATANHHYAAYARRGRVYVENLMLPESDPEPQPLPSPGLSGCSVLALSKLKLALLAVSTGPQILVFDISQQKLLRTIPGLGRTITALSWSYARDGLLFSGAIDGSVALWDTTLHAAASPIAQSRLNGACQAAACCPSDSALFTAVVDGRVSVLRLDGSDILRKLSTVALGEDEVRSLAWHPTDSGRLLVGPRDGQIFTWDFAATSSMGAQDPADSGSDSGGAEDGVFGGLNGLEQPAHHTLGIALAGDVSELQWPCEGLFTCLSQDGHRCSILFLDKGAKTAAEVWSSKLSEPAASAVLSKQFGKLVMAATSAAAVQRLRLPEDVERQVIEMMAEKDNANAVSTLDPAPAIKRQTRSDTKVMMPISIATLRESSASFSKTSKQLRHRKPSSERKHSLGQPGPPSEPKKSAPSSPPLPMSMTSSLELPTQRDDGGSPMPFLSPSIPSRNPSPGEILDLDAAANLPPLPRASFDSSMSSAAPVQDSDDSDDETFVEALKGSASFLPGGINVPLPKACAALFTPTGELLTFFPPKPKLAVTRDQTSEGKHSDPRANAKKIARLFPSFGNLVGEPARSDEDESGFESTSSVSADEDVMQNGSALPFFPSSFASQQSWKARISPTKHSFTEQQSSQKVVIALHDVSGIDALLPASRQLATLYRVKLAPGATAAELCRHNASVAEDMELKDLHGIWSLAVLLLEDRVPFDVSFAGSVDSDVLRLARAADYTSRSVSRRPLMPDEQERNQHMSRGPYGTLGPTWIVQAIFDWAECRADMQTLAIMSAIFSQVQEFISPVAALPRAGIAMPSFASQRDYFSTAGGTEPFRGFAGTPVPMFRTPSTASEAIYESPVKPRASLTASTRHPSQPSTPYLESESSTPPFSFPSLGRQSSRLSASGSASPEHHRSSFSAAAKYYAQSFTDKFASYNAYGTSPPARKLGTSPSNTNELSTSFPSGSWGKSVSFASATSTTKASLLSTSFEETQEDEGYDSDKTIEDLSQPQTPRECEGCVVTYKNEGLLDNDTDGPRQATLLSENMISKCRPWCQYYAEQLRCWDLLLEAAELEKVCGMTCLRTASDQQSLANEQPGAVPTLAPQGSKACSICSIRMTGLRFFCTQCTHSAHLDCLEDFVAVMRQGDDDGAGFACPAGCGCRCDEVPFEVAELAAEVPEMAVEAREEKPKKKASFTDPRRWRARVEGDSW